jgi:hypothetical protein
MTECGDVPRAEPDLTESKRWDETTALGGEFLKHSHRHRLRHSQLSKLPSSQTSELCADMNTCGGASSAANEGVRDTKLR